MNKTRIEDGHAGISTSKRVREVRLGHGHDYFSAFKTSDKELIIYVKCTI